MIDEPINEPGVVIDEATIGPCEFNEDTVKVPVLFIEGTVKIPLRNNDPPIVTSLLATSDPHVATPPIFSESFTVILFVEIDPPEI